MVRNSLVVQILIIRLNQRGFAAGPVTCGFLWAIGFYHSASAGLLLSGIKQRGSGWCLSEKRKGVSKSK
jgi:hypothetical protein